MVSGRIRKRSISQQLGDVEVRRQEPHGDLLALAAERLAGRPSGWGSLPAPGGLPPAACADDPVERAAPSADLALAGYLPCRGRSRRPPTSQRTTGLQDNG